MTVVADKMIQPLCEHAHDKGWHFWKKRETSRGAKLFRISRIRIDIRILGLPRGRRRGAGSLGPADIAVNEQQTWLYWWFSQRYLSACRTKKQVL